MFERRSIHPVFAIFTAIVLAACATTPTPYQPYRAHSASGIHGGYSEQQLGAGDYLVRFHGNSMTSRDRVEGYMLYRAAELTLQNGYDWFDVVDRNTEHNVRTVVEPNPLYRPWYGLGYPGWIPDWNFYVPGSGWHSSVGLGMGPSWPDQYDLRRIESFEASAEIQMHKGLLPPDDRKAIDAHKVTAELGPKIDRPKS